MKNHLRALVCLAAVVLTTTSTQALNVTIQKNGYADLFGGQVTGTGIGAIPLGGNTNDVVLTGLVAGGTYAVDWFHNSGTYGSDFGFTVNAAGTGIQSVTTSGYGAGGQAMVTGFNPGDTTLALNAHNITFNANNTDGLHGITSYYYLQGQFGAYTVPPNGGPVTTKAIPGIVGVDNLTNAGAGNEDYQIFVNGNGMLSAAPGYAGYSLFDGSSAMPITVKVHYRIEATTNTLGAMFVSYQNLVVNAAFHTQQDPTYPYVYEYDMSQPIGSSGQLFPDYDGYTVIGGNMMRSTNYNINVPGASIVGETGPNDFVFAPRLMYGFNGQTDIFWWNTDGSNTVSTAELTGTGPGAVTLGMRINAAIIPEPTSIAIVSVVGGLLMIRRRRNA